MSDDIYASLSTQHDMLLQKAFLFFLMANIPLYICIASLVFHLLMNI